MAPEIQSMIDAIMVRNGVETGVGILTFQDVRQHLQEKVLLALRRFDGSVKPITYLWWRVNGACLDLLRNYGVRDARGMLRMTHPENLIYMDRRKKQAGLQGNTEQDVSRTTDVDWYDSPYDGSDDEAAESLDRVQDISDLTLALSRLPARQRTVMYLLYYEMHTPEETARRLGMTLDLLREIRDSALLKLRLALVERIDVRPAVAIRSG